jgi:hypothetical protein
MLYAALSPCNKRGSESEKEHTTSEAIDLRLKFIKSMVCFRSPRDIMAVNSIQGLRAGEKRDRIGGRHATDVADRPLLPEIGHRFYLGKPAREG